MNKYILWPLIVLLSLTLLISKQMPSDFNVSANESEISESFYSSSIRDHLNSAGSAYLLPGAVSNSIQRFVLFESFTSAFCIGCGSSSSAWSNFVSAYSDSIVVVSYNVGWVGPDPMYLYNTAQNTERRTYYSVSCVPVARIDGILQSGTCAGCSYTTSSCLTNPYFQRRSIQPLLSVSVTDFGPVADSIRTVISVNNQSDLSSGVNYYLRVMVIEKSKTYATPPGTSGQTVFTNVFRRALPSSAGTPHPTASGTYNYEFKYALDTAFVDSLIYTVAFVQRDDTKEVMNAGNSWGKRVGPMHSINLYSLMEGLYRQGSGTMLPDTVSVLLRSSATPYSVIDSARGGVDSGGFSRLEFQNAMDAESYYLVLKNWRSVETWSALPQQFISGSMSYDFTDSDSRAYGGNMVLKGSRYCIYSGDVNQDGTVDIADYAMIDNDVFNFLSGYLATDLTGDFAVDASDAQIAENNSLAFVGVISPLTAIASGTHKLNVRYFEP